MWKSQSILLKVMFLSKFNKTRIYGLLSLGNFEMEFKYLRDKTCKTAHRIVWILLNPRVF